MTGGRTYRFASRVTAALDALDRGEARITALAHGGCSGADECAEGWAVATGTPTTRYKANWTQEGVKAGPLRNGRMLREFRPDVVLAFPGGKGTADCVRQARALGIRVIEVSA